MFRKDKSVRDEFTFSLGGTTVITSVVAAPAIASDRLNERCRAQVERSRNCSGKRRARFKLERISA